MGKSFFAGSAAIDITPAGSVFLAGYPHVRRYSTGIHDPLLSSALCLSDGEHRALFIASDVIYISKSLAASVRERIEKQTGIVGSNILLSATHTHSGPKMADPIATEADDAVPRADSQIVAAIEDGIVEAGCKAARSIIPAEVGLEIADAAGIGTNRRDPGGISDLQVPVLLVRDRSHHPIAAMLICSMHPTVLHEDSTLISGDFPGLARRRLQHDLLGENCPVLYHTGPAGDQSPRHVTRGNTFAEAERLGDLLASASAKAVGKMSFQSSLELDCRQAHVELPLRSFASENDAQRALEKAVARLTSLRASGAEKTQIRTAEVDWFGAQESLALTQAAASGIVTQFAQTAMPAEIQLIRVGPWNFVAWPGELFVQFALDVKSRSPNTFIISYANGELQGYLVTQQAVDEGGYESSNAIFASPESGNRIVAQTLKLLGC